MYPGRGRPGIGGALLTVCFDWKTLGWCPGSDSLCCCLVEVVERTRRGRVVDDDARWGRLTLLRRRHDVNFPAAPGEILGQSTPSKSAYRAVWWKVVAEYEESPNDLHRLTFRAMDEPSVETPRLAQEWSDRRYEPS